MREKEVHKVNEAQAEESTEKGSKLAAFFDLDGTLLPRPSLEHRLCRTLRYRKQIGARNYLAWFREALRLLPRGIGQVVNANKGYLRGIRSAEQRALTIPRFFPEALRRAAWHAERGHQIVIVSGTLQPLALRAARLLEAALATRGIRSCVEVWATQLEEVAETWTGRTVGEAMFGEAKARAIRQFGVSRGIALAGCFAYGDSTSDQWMFEAVGRPTAVNPADDLARIALRNGWPVLWWNKAGNTAEKTKRSQKSWTAQMSGKEIQIAATNRECCR